jgi:hypothetical protein
MRMSLLPLSGRYIAYTFVLLIAAILLFEFLAGYTSLFVVVPLVLFAAVMAANRIWWAFVSRAARGKGASGMRSLWSCMNSVADATASSLPGSSKIAYPPMTSLASTNGPSRTLSFPSVMRTCAPVAIE